MRETNPFQHSDKDLVISRTFEAPRDAVWRAWTDAESLRDWFGPRGYTMLTTRVDLRPGGVFHYGMRSPQGQEMWGKWVFEEVAPPERLVYVSSFSDQSGGTARYPLAPVWPLEVLGELQLTEEGGRTTAILSSHPIRATAEETERFEASVDMMQGGWKATLDQLEAHLATRNRGGNR